MEFGHYDTASAYMVDSLSVAYKISAAYIRWSTKGFALPAFAIHNVLWWVKWNTACSGWHSFC